MLSRHAEGMFWLGRYIERVGDTTRMLDVAYNAQLERPPAAAHQVWRDLLHVLYVEEEFAAKHGDDVTTATMNQFLVFDRDNPSSIATSVLGARTNVMHARDVVPMELLESVNRMHTRVVGGSLERFIGNPHEIYEAMSGYCRAITGAVAEAMARGDEYRYLMAGRLLERAEMTCRMIDVNRGSADGAGWMSVLRSLSGFHAFIKTHGPLAPADDVVKFLLVEPTFPFSVLYCLNRCGEMLNEVSDVGAWQSPRVLGRVRAELEFADVPAIGSDQLGDHLEALEDGVRAVSEALHEDLYKYGGDPSLYSFEAL